MQLFNIHDQYPLTQKLLFGKTVTSLALQAQIFINYFFPTPITLTNVPIILSDNKDILFNNNQILIPNDIESRLTDMLTENQTAQLETTRHQALSAIFLIVIAHNQTITIAHRFTAQAATRYFFWRRRRDMPTFEQTEALPDDHLFAPLFSSAKSSADYINIATTLIQDIVPTTTSQPTDHNISPTILYASQILGLTNSRYKVPPYETTRAKRALSKALSATPQKNIHFSAKSS